MRKRFGEDKRVTLSINAASAVGKAVGCVAHGSLGGTVKRTC
jgi:hypothetical protein